ncbi:DUF1592 domain-containing protein [Novipirellula sp. SH528]|uniref:DUF1592 domain-containing protein n=1 Tax=Novipirellula sp. SH528 TaxID=3454466 RepID=UPI003FA03015
MCATAQSDAAEPIPKSITDFTNEFCVKCHGSDAQQGDFRIDTLSWDLTKSDSREQWDLVFQYVSDGDMPPRKAKAHPGAAEREQFIKALKTGFTLADQSARPGGTPVRRLNRVEYLNTVRDLFGFRMINLPLSFPEDVASTEFDTMPEGLFLSPSVIDAYHESATNIADRFVPLPRSISYTSDLTTETIGVDGVRGWRGKKKVLKFTGFNMSGWVGALWDPLFVAPESGVYRVTLLANAQAETGADGKPFRLSFHAFDPTESELPKRRRIENTTLVAEVEVPTGEPTWIQCDVPMEAGETFHLYCVNRLSPDVFPIGDLNRTQVNGALKKIKKRPEPTVELRGMKIEGPVAVPPRVKEFFGTWPPNLDRVELEAKLLPFAQRAFRRPLTDAESNKLIAAVLKHGEETGKPEFAWHYAIRRLLCSPAFLYRESEREPTALAAGLKHQPEASSDGSHEKPKAFRPLNDFALASRLSYFLWSSLPDKELLDLAAAGKLSDSETLAAQTERLLADPKAQRFVKNFTGQWLGNRDVAVINVCDNRYQWDPTLRYGFIRSTEMFFDEILRENMPISTLVDSDFTYANSAMRVVWGMKTRRDKNLEAVAARRRQSLAWPEPERIDLKDGEQNLPRHVLDRRGVLGLPGVLTVTGDGVESSPILRGVWVLGNLFGQHPPPPPKDVPALDVDTSQAITVRETLAAHQTIETCAKCHRDIDPIGLALENFDAVGGWRDKYIGQKQPIDAKATMPDGTQLSGVDSIRQVLLDKPEIFIRCLLVKLLQYGAGRELSVGDQRVVNAIVKAEPDGGYRFQDLIVAATTSNVFRAK